MKQILNYLIVVLMATLSFASCTSSAKKIVEQAAMEGNKQCPMTVTADVSMTSMTVEGNYLVYSYLVHENIFSVEHILDPMSEETFKQTFSLSDETRVLLNSLIAADMGLIARVKGERSGELKEKKFEPKTVKKMKAETAVPTFDSSADSFLTTTMENNKSLCPLQIDANTILVDCYYKDKQAVYVYTIIENEILDMKVIKDSRDIFENMIKKNLCDESQKAMIILNQKVKEANACYVYKYVGDTSNEEMAIVVNPNDL